MKILCAFDSFKGCLTSARAAEAARKGILSVCPEADVESFICADGGEGMAHAVFAAGIGTRVETVAPDPLMRPVKAGYTLDAGAARGYIDLAEASGITRLSAVEKTPMDTTTYGTGVLIMDAISRGAREIFLGLGGSATNDCGLGAVQAMGARFYRKDGSLIANPVTARIIPDIDRIDTSGLPAGVSYRLLCDVSDGWYDCLRYAPQKGAGEVDLSTLRATLTYIAPILERDGCGACTGPSTGAAGAAGGGLKALLGAGICSGAAAILDINGFAEAAARQPDLVLTGEGCSDLQTLMGKLPAEVLAATPEGVPVALLAGRIEAAEELRRAGFAAVADINAPYTDSDADPLNPAVAATRLKAAAAGIIAGAI